MVRCFSAHRMVPVRLSVDLFLVNKNLSCCSMQLTWPCFSGLSSFTTACLVRKFIFEVKVGVFGVFRGPSHLCCHRRIHASSTYRPTLVRVLLW